MPSQSAPHSPTPFKGIALFTPGGDLVYCIDYYKQSHWHLHLTAVLQDVLGLPEPPHFLSPYYTATIDRWVDTRSGTLHLTAEASPLVLRHRAILNAIFECGDVDWQPIPSLEEMCNPMVMSAYRQQFPQLWEDHDLLIRYEHSEPVASSEHSKDVNLSWSPSHIEDQPQGYVLRLYVSGGSSSTERILQNLHQLLERSLQHPYTLKVVDIHKHPEQAEADQIAATPTLIRVWPAPARRIVGDVDNLAKIMQTLVSLNSH